jgi:hypothetical protein
VAAHTAPRYAQIRVDDFRQNPSNEYVYSYAQRLLDLGVKKEELERAIFIINPLPSLKMEEYHGDRRQEVFRKLAFIEYEAVGKSHRGWSNIVWLVYLFALLILVIVFVFQFFRVVAIYFGM